MRWYVYLIIILAIAGLIFWGYTLLQEDEENKEVRTRLPAIKEPTATQGGTATPTTQETTRPEEQEQNEKVIDLEISESSEYGTRAVYEGKGRQNETLARIIYEGDTIKEAYGKTLEDSDIPLFLKQRSIEDEEGYDIAYRQTLSIKEGLTYSNFTDKRNKSDDNWLLGFNFSSKTNIFDYTLYLQKELPRTTLEEQTIRLLGKDYYLIHYRNQRYTTLEFPHKEKITTNNTIKLYYPGIEGAYTITIDTIDKEELFLNINGNRSKKLEEGQLWKEGQLYTYIEEINSNEYGKGTANLVFTGKKGILGNNEYWQMNEQYYENLETKFYPEEEETISEIHLQWIKDEKSYLTPTENLELDYFKNINFSITNYLEEEDTQNNYAYIYITTFLTELREKQYGININT